MLSSDPRKRLMAMPEAKWIHVYRNGDIFYPGARMVVNSHKLRTFDSLLTSLTEKLDPLFGAVRNIYTPQGGTQVMDFSQIQPNHKYVAAGRERFKPIPGGYLSLAEKLRHKAPRTLPALIKPVVHSRIQVSARYRKMAQLRANTTTVYVFPNGDRYSAPHRFVLSKNDLSNWERTLEDIGLKMNLYNGTLKQLCTLSGESVENSDSLSNGGCYVAVTNYEGFKPTKYRTHLARSATLSTSGRRRKRLSSRSLPSRRRRRSEPSSRGFDSAYHTDDGSRGVTSETQTPRRSPSYVTSTPTGSGKSRTSALVLPLGGILPAHLFMNSDEETSPITSPAPSQLDTSSEKTPSKDVLKKKKKKKEEEDDHNKRTSPLDTTPAAITESASTPNAPTYSKTSIPPITKSNSLPCTMKLSDSKSKVSTIPKTASVVERKSEEKVISVVELPPIESGSLIDDTKTSSQQKNTKKQKSVSNVVPDELPAISTPQLPKPKPAIQSTGSLPNLKPSTPMAEMESRKMGSDPGVGLRRQKTLVALPKSPLTETDKKIIDSSSLKSKKSEDKISTSVVPTPKKDLVAKKIDDEKTETKTSKSVLQTTKVKTLPLPRETTPGSPKILMPPLQTAPEPIKAPKPSVTAPPSPVAKQKKSMTKSMSMSVPDLDSTTVTSSKKAFQSTSKETEPKKLEPSVESTSQENENETKPLQGMVKPRPVYVMPRPRTIDLDQKKSHSSDDREINKENRNHNNNYMKEKDLHNPAKAERKPHKNIFKAEEKQPLVNGSRVVEVDLDRDQGGIFRAKRSIRSRPAQEVPDSPDTVVDVPIDAVEGAETEIPEEDISDEKTGKAQVR